MIVSLRSCRRFLLIGAGLLVAVAVVVAVGVIPPVRADSFPAATPERAVPAFWGNVVINLLAATVLVFIAMRTSDRTRRATIGLGLLAFLALLLAFALTDAASAFGSHGAALRPATILLYLCSAADFLAGVLILTTAFLFPKRT